MKIPAMLTVAAAAMVTLSACGSSMSSSNGGGGSAAGSNGSGNNVNAGASAGLHVASTSLGKILVDAQGHTVYTLSADSQNNSTCAGPCLSVWPAVSPGGHLPGVQLGSTGAQGGGSIATVNGMPVYTFIDDHAPGDVSGEGRNEFGGLWYAVSPTGQAVKSPQKATSGSSSSSGPATGGGYGY
jgi:predicted lipoprotein with Yx(FWY)xxD motif